MGPPHLSKRNVVVGDAAYFEIVWTVRRRRDFGRRVPLEQNFFGSIPEFEPIKRVIAELAEERLGPAAIHQAAFFARLRALAIVAQAAAIAIRAGLQNVHIHLEMRHADLPFGKQQVQRPPSRLLHILETREIRRPNGQIHIVAFMPHLDAIAPEFGEARNLLLQMLRYRTEHCYSYDLRQEGQFPGYVLGRSPEIALAAQHHRILIFGLPECGRLAFLPQKLLVA